MLMLLFLFFQDPLSHRIIEKRRRDRMNNCLADLSRLIPTNYMKQVSTRALQTYQALVLHFISELIV